MARRPRPARGSHRLRLGRVSTRLALTGLLVPAVHLVTVAAPASADVECEVGTTRYVTQSSYNLKALGIPQSWRLATGRGVTVAVVDSGVDPANQHLGDVVLPGASFVPGDPTGREDPYGHGTAVAGIIAGRYLAGTSALIGAAPDAKILPVRVFAFESDQAGESVTDPPDTSRMADGIRWAVTHGADVVNVSMSTGPRDPELPALKAALALARTRDVVVVASGGNQREDTPHTELRYPAAGPGVIGVAATNGSGAVDDWSVHGPQNDVAAPGSEVLISYHANGDCLAGGDHPYTSWSAGFVSALAAQLRERFPQESAAQIAYRITASADRPRQGARDDAQGWGLIQPNEALTMTLDEDRAGPPLPGARAGAAADEPSSAVRAVSATPDPLAPARRDALWWGLLALGVAASALVLRPLVLRTVARARG